MTYDDWKTTDATGDQIAADEERDRLEGEIETERAVIAAQAERDEARAGYARLEESCMALNLIALARAREIDSLKLEIERLREEVDLAFQRGVAAGRSNE